MCFAFLWQAQGPMCPFQRSYGTPVCQGPMKPDNLSWEIPEAEIDAEDEDLEIEIVELIVIERTLTRTNEAQPPFSIFPRSEPSDSGPSLRLTPNTEH